MLSSIVSVSRNGKCIARSGHVGPNRSLSANVIICKIHHLPKFGIAISPRSLSARGALLSGCDDKPAKSQRQRFGNDAYNPMSTPNRKSKQLVTPPFMGCWLRENEMFITCNEFRSTHQYTFTGNLSLRTASSKTEQSACTVGDRDVKRKAALKRRVSFFLSDINLRHNKDARCAHQECANRGMLLETMLKYKSIQKYTSDASFLREAVNSSSEDESALDQSSVKLSIEETDRGETLIVRTPPFNYIESIRKSRSKMMTIEGWPHSFVHGGKYHQAAESIRSLFCTDPGSKDQIPMAYWRFFHNDEGTVLDIEFESEEGAMAAWGKLEQATAQVSDNAADSSTSQIIKVKLLADDQQNRSYQIQVGDFTVVARSIDMAMIIEKFMLDRASNGATMSIITPKETKFGDQAMNAHAAQSPILSSYRKWQGKETPTLQQFTRTVDGMYGEHIELPPPDREWLHEPHFANVVSRSQRSRPRMSREQNNIVEDAGSQDQLLAKRQELFRDVTNLISCVKSSIAQGKIRALGSKDGYALTDAFGRAMLIYSECPSDMNIQSNEKKRSIKRNSSRRYELSLSPFEACCDVIDILRKLNLDIHPSHYSYAIRSALHESRWNEAASLFLDQINGDDTGLSTGGLVPINPKLGWDQPLELGLYAVARNSLQALNRTTKLGEETDSMASPSKRVFDTAMKMCMISPSGQESYIIASGLALGRAGLWRDCLDLALDSDAISSYGPSIAAATMLACIECSQPYKALFAYNFFLSSNQGTASEWQWSGGQLTAAKPICRDLALQAMGSVRKGGFSRDAIELFGEILNEDSPFSRNALLGVAHSLEHDGNWEYSIQLLTSFIDTIRNEGPSSWRILSDPSEFQGGNTGESFITPEERLDLLSQVLASTMRVCNAEGEQGLALLLYSIANISYKSGRPGPSEDTTSIATKILSQKMVVENEEILEACTEAFYWLGCFPIANNLQNRAVVPDSNGSTKVSRNNESWTNAFVAIERVLEATNQLDVSKMTDDCQLLFKRGLARAMDHCIDAKQPATAIYLFHHVSATFTKKDSSLAGRVKSFFGVDASTSQAIFQNKYAIDFTELHLSDSVLAAIIRAYGKMGRPDKARSAYYDGTMNSDGSTIMAQSANNMLDVLLDSDVDESMPFLNTMDVRCLNPSTFMLVAKRYAEMGIWPKIGEVYNSARNAGCISEELGLITMKAVCESELLNGKVNILRKIILDITRLVGMKSDEYINAKYWQIKRYVGFHHARLLMNWNDPATSQKDELLFAIREMRQCAGEGTVVKNAPLECIVRIAKVYDTDGKIESALSEKQKRSAVNLILEAWVEATKSGLIKKHSFTAEVVRSLRALKANRECIQVVLANLITAGQKCRHRIAMEEAMYAALEERDHQSLQLLTEVFERSGYDPRRLSI